MSALGIALVKADLTRDVLRRERKALQARYDEAEETGDYGDIDRDAAEMDTDHVDRLERALTGLMAAVGQRLAADADEARRALTPADTVTVKIEGGYVNGREYSRTITVAPPADNVALWWDDVVFPHTGDGVADIDGFHWAEILDGPHAGETMEWAG